MKNILRIDASARGADSQSRAMADQVLAQLSMRHDEVSVIERDLRVALPAVSEDWITAAYTPPEQRSETQRSLLSQSDSLIDELRATDALVISTPMYNFSIPASLKAWVDQVCRVGETFRYTETGPQGLLADRPAIITMATGGVAIGSDYDYASDYLRHVLSFIGITNVHLVAAEALNVDPQKAIDNAAFQLRQLVGELEQSFAA